MIHQRTGALLSSVQGRLATAPAWTAVEVARTLRRPRALAVLDAALHVEACTAAELEAAAREQKGRRGIVRVREMLVHADGRSESPMESEARLVFIDGGLPLPASSTRFAIGTANSGESTSRGRRQWSSQSTRAWSGTPARRR
jgi:hypothetical protein